jgi:hypothetical protein
MFDSQAIKHRIRERERYREIMRNPEQAAKFKTHRHELEQERRKNPEYIENIRLKARIAMKQWREKHPDRVRAYRERTKEQMTPYFKAYYQRNKEKYAKRQRDNLQHVEEMHNKWHHAKRMEAFEKLGGECKRCGFSDWRALQIDHIEGGGSQHYLKRNSGGVLKDILSEQDCSSKYQLLCANCNWIKRFERKEHC